MTPQPLHKSVFVQVLAAIAAGILFGYLAPEQAVAMRPLGDGFIKLIKMMIAPVVFTTVVVGIAQMGAMKDVVRIGFRALVYFEVVSTVALVIGLVVVTVVKPGSGLTMNAADLDVKAVAAYATASQSLNTTEFLLNIIPNTVVDAFARGEVLQVLLFSVLFGLALLTLGRPARPLVALLEQVSHTLFAIINMLMRLAPIGAFGAMAFTVAKFGVATLYALGLLVGTAWAMMAVFIFIVLGVICRLVNIRLMDLLRMLRTELLVVLGTSSSETAIPGMMEKLPAAGVARAVAGLVIPAGYSFNLDGVALTLPLSTLFVAQVYGIELTTAQQVSIFVVMLFTSKGAAGVTGGAFAALAATVVAAGLPVEGLALLLGIDRFMSLARAVTNTIGNAVAAIVVARWDGAFDPKAWEQSVAQIHTQTHIAK